MTHHADAGHGMTFLEAHKLQAGFAGGPPLNFLLGISGAAEKLGVFFRAAGALRGRSVKVRTLPFNTLGQTALAEPVPGETEVFVLFPWDFVPETDWRSGLPASALDLAVVHDRARTFAGHLERRPLARIFYVPAPIPPVFPAPAATRDLGVWLTSLAGGIGATLMGADVFSLGSYLSTGTPFAGTHLGEVAMRVVDRALGDHPAEAKVLVTDLDNVLWKGVIGEDGLEGIRYSSEGVGFRHFIYQTALAKLKREGTLLAAVSRNDDELARSPFMSGQMTLRIEDFVVIAASYNAKSAQIREIATQLNLGLDSFVFVDDNPIEIEEVSRALPDVKTLIFPSSDDALAAFLDRLSSLFARPFVTPEDTERTEMYRRRLEGMAPAAAEGADLTAFLRDLRMSMIVHDRTHGDRARAVQLINKTNQFNLNGRRVTDEEIADVLAAGGRLYTATLTDRTGSHGEILACLIDSMGVVRSLVMSCRVFQRRVEHAFFCWLAGEEPSATAVEFKATSRNEPLRLFLQSPGFGATAPDGIIAINLEEFRRRHLGDVDMLDLVPPQAAAR